MSNSLQIKSQNGVFNGYLALPETTPAPGIIVLQEIFGVNKVMRNVCDWLAGQGYCALCPDLFWRIEPGIDISDQNDEELKRAFALFGLFDVNLGMTDITLSITALRQHPACTGAVGALGYCLGGKLAFLAATRTDADACVSYYGVAIDQHLDEAPAISKPLLMHMAGKDEFVPPSAQNSIVSGLKGHPLVSISRYGEMGHAFARPGGAHYDKAAASLANSRSLAFLKTALM